MRLPSWLSRVPRETAAERQAHKPCHQRLGDIPLFALSPVDEITIGEASQGILVLGGVGSGKTSGSGQMLARCCLRAGMGGLVLCAKPDEADLWRRYCAEEGRAADLIVMNREGSATFNFLDYELRQSG